MSLLPFKKILAPVDFSDHARRALKSAAELAAQFNATLYVIHVVAPIPLMDMAEASDFGISGPVGGVDVATFQKELLANGKSSLAKIVCETVPEDISVQVFVETGDPATVIVDSAAKEKIDVIVMATHGLTGLSHLLMGSVAEKVVRHAAVPVLIVRQSEEGEPSSSEPKEE